MHTVWEEVSFVLMKGKEGENVYANMTSQDFQIYLSQLMSIQAYQIL